MLNYFTVVKRPDIAQKEIVLRHFIRVWNQFYGKTEELFKNILSYRNIMLMAQPCNDKIVWINMARFLAFLIKTEVITCDNFEFQCTAFYQRNWNVVIINQHIHYIWYINREIFYIRFVHIAIMKILIGPVLSVFLLSCYTCNCLFTSSYFNKFYLILRKFLSHFKFPFQVS